MENKFITYALIKFANITHLYVSKIVNAKPIIYNVKNLIGIL